MDQRPLELRFLLPQAARTAVVAELERGTATLDRTTLVATYLDTDDRHLARAGLTWRLRREGRRWIQTLTAVDPSALERYKHEAILPMGSPDPSVHSGTPPGNRLIELLRRARAHGFEPGARFRSEIRRTARRIRTTGAVIDVAFDDGRLVAGDATQRIREVEFTLVSGSPVAMLALVERWCKRFALVHDPRSEEERGNRLADGVPFPPVRKAGRLHYAGDATASEAFAHVVDDCLAQITGNAIGLTEGDLSHRVEHVHQLRIGIRRLRSALRSFQGWVPTPPVDLVAGLRSLFATLGSSRDNDVLASGVAADLASADAPPVALPPGPSGPDPADAVKAADTQHTLLAWIAWRAALLPPPAVAAADVATEVPSDHQAAPDACGVEGDSHGAAAEPAGNSPADAAKPASVDNPRAFRRNATRRLRRWHARIAADWKAFDELDDAGLHELRKRIKRQRYAVEFFAPLFRRRQVERYLEHLAAIQDRMGALNDVFVARARYQSLSSRDPAVWFALGWLSARITELRALARPELARLVKAEPPAP